MGLFSLIFRLGTDNTDFNKGIDQSVSRADRAAGQMSSAFQRHIAAAFSIGAISAAAKKTIDYASNINDLSEASGIARETIQELDYAMRKNGSTIEAAIKAARELSKARAEALAEPGGDKDRLFQQFGIGREELQSLTNGGDLLKRLSDALKGVNVDANSLPGILELIGSKNQEVIPALIEGLRDLGDEARKSGLIMKDEVVEQLDEIGDKITELSKRITVELGPAILFLVRVLDYAVDSQRAMLSGFKEAAKNVANYGLTGRDFGRMAGGAPGASKETPGEAFARAQREEFQRMAEERAARQLARNKSRPGLDIDLEAGGGKELNRLREQIAAAQRATLFAGLSPEQRRAQLQKELEEARQGNRNFGIADRPGVEQGKIDLRIAKAEQALAEFDARDKRSNFAEALLKPNQSDSLVSVGNFLGSNPAADTNSTLKRVEAVLERIDRNTARTADNGIVLE